MEVPLLQEVTQLAGVVGRISSKAEGLGNAVTDDLKAWMCKPQTDRNWLEARNGQSVWQLLEEVLHKNRELVDEAAYYHTDNDAELQQAELQLTIALTQLDSVPPWLRLRMGVYATELKGKVEEAEQLRSHLGLEGCNLELLRNLTVLDQIVPDKLSTTRTDGDSAQPFSWAKFLDDEAATAATELLSGMPAGVRTALRENQGPREAMDCLGARPSIGDYLAADTAYRRARELLSQGDIAGAQVAVLICSLMLEDIDGAYLFPSCRWSEMRSELADGQDKSLSGVTTVCERNRLIIMGQGSAKVPPPPVVGWLGRMTAWYWVTFRDKVASPKPDWIRDVLSLLAAVHKVANPETPLPAIVAGFRENLALDIPVPPSGKTVLGVLTQAILELNLELFESAMTADSSEVAVKYLLEPPHDEDGAARILDLQGLTVRDHLRKASYERCANAAKSAKLRALIELTYVALGDSQGGLQNQVFQLLAKLVDKTAAVREFATAEFSTLEEVPAGKLLQFLKENHTALGHCIPEMKTLIQSLFKEYCDDLSSQMAPDVANNPDSRFCLAQLLFNDEVDTGRLLTTYVLGRADIERILADFYEGKVEALSRTVEVRLAIGPFPEPPKWHARVARIRRNVTALRIYAGLTVVLLLVGVFTYVRFSHDQASSDTMTDPTRIAEWSGMKYAEFLSAHELKSLPLTSAGQPCFIAERLVTNGLYSEIMGRPANRVLSEPGNMQGEPVRHASSEEAELFCHRLSQYLAVANPDLFADNFKGYAVRLPREDELRSWSLAASEGPTIPEWIAGPDSPVPQAGDSQTFGPRSAVISAAEGIKPIARHGWDGPTAFRFVLAPRESGQ